MRYIGNKNKLLNEIDLLLQEKDLKKEGLTFFDAFSGSATVSNFFNGFYKIIANDFLNFAYHYSSGILLYNNSSFDKLGFNPFSYFESSDTSNYKNGFCFNNFSPNGGCQYFSDENAKKIDFIRDTIDEWFLKEKISSEEKSYLIACLMESISKVSNVAGVYSAFLKIWDSRAVKPMKYLPIEIKTTKYKNMVYCEDVIDLAKTINGDIIYLDPPYTPTQYNSQYHVLETISRNDNPKTHGVGKHRDNDRLSNWSKKGAAEFEFEKLIKETNFKHIIFSYSDKGLMSTRFIEAVLKRYGKLDSFVCKKISFVKYKSTRAVKKEITDGSKLDVHYEYLFYIEKKEEIKYVSPLNYIGGKFDSIDLIIKYLPKNINTFYDLFGGGATVGLNCKAKKVIYNDINPFVVSLLKYLATTHPADVYRETVRYQKKFNLQKCDKVGYAALRAEYNKSKSNILLYLLICYGFEHQIRFNSKHEFNNPCGNSGFNDEMFEKIISYYLRCNEIGIIFKCGSYGDYLNRINRDDFIYLDPPYLGNAGAYQDGKRGFNGWDIEQEKLLHLFIEKLNNKSYSFMLSNYIDHTNGNSNPLEDWAKENKFNFIISDKIIKRNRQSRREIIITNYVSYDYENKSKNI